jgi:hypothetical protein
VNGRVAWAQPAADVLSAGVSIQPPHSDHLSGPLDTARSATPGRRDSTKAPRLEGEEFHDHLDTFRSLNDA